MLMVHFTVLVSNIMSLQFNIKVYLINAPTAKGRIKMEFKNKGGIETYIIQRVALLTPVILKAFFATNYPTLPRSHQKKNYNQSTKQ